MTAQQSADTPGPGNPNSGLGGRGPYCAGATKAARKLVSDGR